MEVWGWLKVWVCVILLIMVWKCTEARADFKPLTRDEPVVRMVLQEGANEPFAGMVAIAGVAYDRAVDQRWPASVMGVVYEPAQFTGMDLSLRDYSQAQVTRARLAVVEAYLGTRPCGVVLWYHTDQVYPVWRKRLTVKCQLGAHIFYGDDK